jgi:AAA domain
VSRTETTRQRLDREADEWAAKQNGHKSEAERARAVAETARLISIEDEAAELAAKKKAKPKKPLVLEKADLSKSRPPRWAWDGRILMRYLNLLIGPEGEGKGTLMPWVFASLSRGRLSGSLYGKQVTVAIIADEDDFHEIWTPRLYVAGADLSKVQRIRQPDGGYIALGANRDQIAEAVEACGAKLLYLDALLDNLGFEVNDWRAKSVRDALAPANWLARELGIAVVGTLHTNKAGGASFRQTVQGSQAFNAVSRSSFLLAKDPDEDGRVVLVRGKGNHAARPRAITFEIESRRFVYKKRQFNMPKAVRFRDGGDLSADDLLAALHENQKASKRVSKTAQLEDLIRELLPEDGEWHLATPIVRQCESKGYPARTVTRARDKLGIYHRRQPGSVPAATEWSWAPPTAASTTATNTDGRTGGTGRSGQTPSNASAATTATTDPPTCGRSGGRTGASGKRKAER